MKPITDRPAFAVWFTGLPAAGKTTIAGAFARILRGGGFPVIVLDSDELRAVLTLEGQFDPQGRLRFYRALAAIAELLVRQGVPVVIAATANLRIYREHARTLIPHFFEVLVKTQLETCMARDPKGIYKKGQDVVHVNVPGLDVAYEEPLRPELTVDGQNESPDAAARRVTLGLIDAGLLSPQILDAA